MPSLVLQRSKIVAGHQGKADLHLSLELVDSLGNFGILAGGPDFLADPR
jgi:hypothetical protein